MHLAKRLAVGLAAVCAVAGLVGCGELDHKRTDASSEKKSATTQQQTERKAAPKSPAASLSRVVAPAADAGGLCRSLDYGVVHDTTGLDFDVAAPSQSSGTQACALQSVSAELPTLTYSSVDAQVKPSDFGSDFQPDGANKVDGLGQAAYSKVSNGSNGSGPAVEVGWSSGQKVFTLALLTPNNTSGDDANGYVGKLTDLAKKIK